MLNRITVLVDLLEGLFIACIHISHQIRVNRIVTAAVSVARGPSFFQIIRSILLDNQAGFPSASTKYVIWAYCVLYLCPEQVVGKEVHPRINHDCSPGRKIVEFRCQFPGVVLGEETRPLTCEDRRDMLRNSPFLRRHINRGG